MKDQAMHSALPGTAPVAGGTPNAEAILDAAERLFAQKGFSAVSMRQIATESGQHLASANYYFGSKNGLFEAVFVKLIVPVNQRRVQLLEERVSQGMTSTEDIVDSYIRPLYESDPEGDAGRRARLIMLFSKQVLSNPDEHKYLQNYYENVARAYIKQLRLCLPGVSMADAIWAYNYMISILVFTLAGKACTAKVPDDFLVALNNEEDDEVTITRLKRFICAGMQSLDKD